MVGVSLALFTIIVKVSQALALAVLAARAVSAAGAAAAETILSGFDTLPQHHLVDEAEITGKHGIVDVVDHCDGYGIVCRE